MTTEYTPTAEEMAEGYAVIDTFAAAMKAEINANRWKGMRQQWKSMDVNEGLAELHYHVSKLVYALRHGDVEKEVRAKYPAPADRASGAPPVIEYAADIANCALIVADIAHGIELPLRIGGDMDRACEIWERAKQLMNEGENNGEQA